MVEEKVIGASLWSRYVEVEVDPDNQSIEISCKLGFWSVEGSIFNAADILEQAEGYFEQYLESGEYSPVGTHDVHPNNNPVKVPAVSHMYKAIEGLEGRIKTLEDVLRGFVELPLYSHHKGNLQAQVTVCAKVSEEDLKILGVDKVAPVLHNTPS